MLFYCVYLSKYKPVILNSRIAVLEFDNHMQVIFLHVLMSVMSL